MKYKYDQRPPNNSQKYEIPTKYKISTNLDCQIDVE